MKKKKILKLSILLSLASILTASAIFGSQKTSAEERLSGLCSQQEINERLSELKNDGLLIRKNSQNKFMRMPCNANEPVFVGMSSEYDNHPEIKQVVKESLDYVFGMLHDINSDYSYKLVEQNELSKHEKNQKTTLFIDLDNDLLQNRSASASGIEQNHSTYYDKLSGATTSSKGFVCLNLNDFENMSINKRKNTIIHDISHFVFQLDDVYINSTINNIHGISGYRGIKSSSLMSNRNLTFFTPYDYSASLSSYSKPGTSIDTLKSKLEDYTSKFYEEYDLLCFNNIKNAKPVSAKDIKKLTWETEFVDNNQIYQYDIEINNNQYCFTIKDKNDNSTLGKSSGSLYESEHFVFLENVFFENGYTPYSLNQADNWAIYKNTNNKFNVYVLSDNETFHNVSSTVNNEFSK